jgi:hypothetical protein
MSDKTIWDEPTIIKLILSAHISALGTLRLDDARRFIDLVNFRLAGMGILYSYVLTGDGVIVRHYEEPKGKINI